MFTRFIKRWLIQDDNVQSKQSRTRIGYFGGSIGIITNLFLFIIKFVIGLLTNSLAVIADGFNNLSDVGSSFVTIFGFKLSSKPADKEHPYGHGRIEYLSGLLVAILVIIVGVEFLTQSVRRVLNPVPITFAWLPFILLLLSIIIKLGLGFFNRKLGRLISSNALKASSMDAFTDCISSSVVALSYFISRFTDFPLDGFMGLLVSVIILYAGYQLVKDTIHPLLGAAPEPELVQAIKIQLLKYPVIKGVHDLLIHNYGPGRIFGSIHVEVPASSSIVDIHETIDQAERAIYETLDIYLVIHVDPIITDDEEVIIARNHLTHVLRSFPEILSFHDFRVVREGKKKKLVLDVVVNQDHHYTKEEELSLEKRIRTDLQINYPEYDVAITVEQDFLGIDSFE